MRFVNYILAAAIAASLPLQPILGAAPNPATRQAQAEVKIPFNPPLDVPLHYRFVGSRTRNGKPVETELRFDLTFSRDEKGYRATVQYEIPAALKGAPTSAIGLIARPYVFQLNQDAEIIGIEDEIELWKQSLAMLNGLPDMSKDENLRKFMDQAMQRMRSMPDAERFALWAKNVQPIWDYASTSFPVGETLRAETASQSPLGGTITSVVEGGLEQVEGSNAHFKSVTYMDAKALAEALEGLIKAIPDEARRAKAAAEMKAVGGVRRDDTAVVSMVTGLSTMYRSEASAGEGAERAVQRTLIEQVR